MWHLYNLIQEVTLHLKPLLHIVKLMLSWVHRVMKSERQLFGRSSYRQSYKRVSPLHAFLNNLDEYKLPRRLDRRNLTERR